MKYLLAFLVFCAGITPGAISQPTSDSDFEPPDPKVAFLKSIAVPGWGHYYVNNKNWTRGKYHLGVEAALVLGYLGLSVHSNNLQQNWYAYGSKEAGIAIEGRSRQFQLAVGDFNSLEAYNDYQARSRNWDRTFNDIPENQWQWSSAQARSQYNDIRSRFESIDQQLPALLALMALNRIISGISAYNRAKKRAESQSGNTVYLSRYYNNRGIVANLKIRF